MVRTIQERNRFSGSHGYEKLTYLKTLVVGKAKLAIADVAYSGRFYRDTFKTLERKFGQPQVVFGAYFDKLSNFPPVKMHNSEQIISYANFIASIIGVFRSLNYDNDLNGGSMLNQALSKLPQFCANSGLCTRLIRT